MGELINFDNLKENKELLKKSFYKVNSEIKDYINDEDNEKDEVFLSLYSHFLTIYNKVEKDSWIKIKNVNDFINNVEKYSKDDDLYNQLSLKLEYINLVDVTNADVLNEDEKFIIPLLDSICESGEIEVEDYNFLYNNLKNKILKEIINSKTDRKSKKIVIEDMIYLIEAGYNIAEIKNVFNESNVKEEKLDSIDSIHSYYLNQIIFVYDNFNRNGDLADEIIDNIDMIVMLNHYNQIIKSKFIYIVNEFESKNIKLTSRLKLISDLVEIFFSLDDDLNMFDSETIINMVVYKNINALTADEAIDSFKEYMNAKGGMKK